jgi:hypothetical protein
LRRSFKVATVFTGAAALAGGGGPAALAATQAAVPQPAYTAEECGANDGGVSHWVHLYYPNDDHPAECLGGTTTSHAVGAIVASFCPGNNSGFFTASYNGVEIDTVTGSPERFGWIGGDGRVGVSYYTQHSKVNIKTITINGDKGEATC